MTRPVVDAAGFAALTCNRCGQCCERMHLDFAPGDKLTTLQEHPEYHYEGMTHEESVADAAMVQDMLEPTEPYADGAPSWRCRHFARDAAGLGVCTVYDRRPRMCSRFPYGQPQVFPGCSWHVRLVKQLLPMAAT